ncbi:MAG: hypothetical protein ACE366_18985 [Bradymonadia bacterium]
MRINRLLLALLCLALAACDDSGGDATETPTPDASVTPDAVVDTADQDVPEPDPDQGVCMEGEEGCACGLNDFCEFGLTCEEGVCVAPCSDGAAGCPCDVEADPIGCGEDLICDADESTCRDPESCEELECAEHELCAEPELAGDLPRCLGECEPGYEWIAGEEEGEGTCQMIEGLTCDQLDCAASGRECDEMENGATCGECLGGYINDAGSCRLAVTCEAAGCAAANRACVEVVDADATCGDCLDGFIDQGGVCISSMQANCDADADGSIAAACAEEGRTCVEDDNGAQCGACVEGLVQNEAGLCATPSYCDDLNCGALGRTCAGDPFAACGECENGTEPIDPEDPLSACVAPLTCADIVCNAGEFCLEGNGGDAECLMEPCGEGEAFRADQNRCLVCELNCGEEGETGDVWPFTMEFSDDCLCETQTGYYADISGAVRAKACDADGDGWVRVSAQSSIESSDEAISDNARCALREVDEVHLENELGQRYTLRACEDGWAEPGEDLDCDLRPVGLYETVRNDDVVELGRSADVPTFAAGGVGRDLRPEELNTLTKACVSTIADYNDNEIADVNEHHDTAPPAALDSALQPFLELSYFVELHTSYYEAPGNNEVYGAYVISERSRCSAGFPVGYAESEGSYWRSCMRNRDVDYTEDGDALTPVGYDFARFSCDSAEGSCDTPTPVTGDGPDDEVVPHDLCSVPAPADGIWRGMNHASQFRCAVITAEAELPENRGDSPQALTPAELFNGVQTTRAWQMNVCHVDCPAGDDSCEADCGDDGCATSSAAPGGLENPSDPSLTCTAVAQGDADDVFTAGSVGFVSARYVDTAGAYVRGCINEWAPGSADDAWKNLCPGYAQNPAGVVGDANAANFGKLLCGCGFGYGGATCELGCPELAIDTTGDGRTDTDVGPLHYGGDLDDEACDNGYCPNDPTSDDGGRRGWWMCGSFAITETVESNAADPRALEGGSFSVIGGVNNMGFSGESCENDDCNVGWSTRPTTAADR